MPELVDTSIWIDHFRSRNRRLSLLLETGEEIFALRDRLPKAVAATDQDVRGWIESRKLWSRGIGWVDAHLAASALLTPCALWTLDARLARVAASFDVAI